MTIKLSSLYRNHDANLLILMSLVLAIIIAISARLFILNGYIFGAENNEAVFFEQFVYIMDNEVNCKKRQVFNLSFEIDKCSVLNSNQLYRLSGRYINQTANILNIENTLIDSSQYPIEFDVFSIDHQLSRFSSFMEVVQSKMKNNFYDYLNSRLDGDIRVLSPSMALGRTEAVNDKDLRLIMSQIGLSHLLAVSGFHLNMVYSIVEKVVAVFSSFFRLPSNYLFGRFIQNGQYGGVSCKVRAKLLFGLLKVLKSLLVFFSLIILILYAVLVGSGSSVLRALIVIIIRLIDKSFLHIGLNSLSVFAVMLSSMLIYNPFFVMDLSWELSVLAYFGIIVSSVFIPRCKFFRSSFGVALGSVIVVQLFTAPLAIVYFGSFNYVLFISNLLLVGPIMILFSGTIWLYLFDSLLFGRFELLNGVGDFFSYGLSFFAVRVDEFMGFLSALGWTLPVRVSVFSVRAIILYYLMLMCFIAHSYRFGGQYFKKS